MPDLIDIRLAVNQEIQTRKFHGLTLMVAAVSLIIVSGSVLFGLHLPVTVLSLILIIFFYVKNKKEIERLTDKYE